MDRARLRRFIERIALASLPLWPSACGGERATSDAAVDAGVVIVEEDAGCPPETLGCTWFKYVDGGAANDRIQYWGRDAGTDVCAPCAFGDKKGVYCGSCEVVANQCGTAYFCSVIDCALTCDGQGAGRRPPGLIAPLARGGDGRAAWLARMAHLEGASVPAFAQLAAELTAHGAPERLVAGARRARLDEERHARVVGELARRAGARPLTLDVTPTPVRPLVELAVENAVEGCVRETAGAVVAARHAQLVADAREARLFAAIAVDERRHANLSWAIDAWAATLLSPAERRRVDAARAEAIGYSLRNTVIGSTLVARRAGT
jgi:hypothetical protein